MPFRPIDLPSPLGRPRKCAAHFVHLESLQTESCRVPRGPLGVAGELLPGQGRHPGLADLELAVLHGGGAENGG